ncbi:MAG: ABC transporter substrate-binding protein [Suipraeoptans sp.]
MFLFRKICTVFGVLLLIFSLSGCGVTELDGAPYKAKNEKYLGLRDTKGNEIKLSKQPERIVSLTIRSDELLWEMIDHKRIVALSKWANDPLISNIANQVGDMPLQNTISEESIIALHPDLVIVSQSQPYDLIYRLRSLDIPVFVCPMPKTIKDSEKMILELGVLLGASKNAEKIVSQMEDRLQMIQEKLAGIPKEKRVMVYRFSISGGSGGKNSYFTDVCEQAGVINAAAEMNFWGTQLMPKEQIVNLNPDVVLLPTWDYNGKIDTEEYARDILNDPSLQTVKAIVNKRLYSIPDTHMLSSSQYMVEAVVDIYEACYGQGEPVFQ